MELLEERRDRQRGALIDAAERVIGESGLSGLKARELAKEIGCSPGTIYNLVADMDELTLRVGSRTLGRLDKALEEAEGQAIPDCPEKAVEQLVAIGLAYCRFARANLHLWRTLFEHRLAEGSRLPDWAVAEQMNLFRHIALPLETLMPKADRETIAMFTRTMFSSVHGIIALGLDGKLVAVPVRDLERQIDALVRVVCRGLESGDGIVL